MRKVSTKHQMILAKQCNAITSGFNDETKKQIARAIARCEAKGSHSICAELELIKKIETELLKESDEWFLDIQKQVWRFL